MTLHAQPQTCHTPNQTQRTIKSGLITDPAQAEPTRIEMTNLITISGILEIWGWISSKILVIVVWISDHQHHLLR